MAWDIANATYVSTKNVSAKSTFPSSVTFSPDGTKMFVSGWDNDSVYRYDMAPAVTAVTGDVAYTEEDDTVSATGTSGLTVPTGLYVVAKTGSSVTVGWDAVTGVDAYEVDRDLVVVATDVTATQYQDTGLDPSTEYSYRVRSVVYS